ncbi:MAG: hypothetical protein LKJ29_07830 [Lactobacillus sp.]|jgi:chromosome segregation ATPase|uniref:Cell-wall binding lipoprotein n=1 Tax=Lacticaseibacillus suilingensis TaxID=2799577 RepID=A0ABW4BG47_9LACO|nr:hypothetical protein [Lacticaseibacillus suilingensis]MCI1893893.1 hypothetical protein [Lactobacillus sp.]MCI1917407.1 hypothetical protein [Lactobacillus sp.]MCI1941947.1 hypothetical protein [Lactobacillus sp.]MCI1972914.1 hypothetical protein [Lactobacillus sp.]MCI2016687.1 hypothetical protein [Lactobacillus sp.]
MKKIGLVIASLLLLAGCSTAVFDQKTQLNDAAQTILTQVSKKTTLMNELDADAGAFPSTFEAAYNKDPNQDFSSEGPVAALISKREATYKKLETSQNKIEQANTTLTKINAQGSKLPQQRLSDALNSLKLAHLDHKTFVTYYDELTTAETTFFKTVSNDPSDHKAVEAALTRLMQYTSSLSQQAEIVSANLETVTTETKSLQKAIAKLD